VAPQIGDGVIMYPNSAIIGRTKVGDHTVLSQGAGLVNCDSPGRCNVFRGENGRPIFKDIDASMKPIEEYFRL
jgi:serine O-acetyltransferase